MITLLAPALRRRTILDRLRGRTQAVTELDAAARINLDPAGEGDSLHAGKGLATVTPISRHLETCNEHPNLAAQWRTHTTDGVTHLCDDCRTAHRGLAVTTGGAR